MVFNKILNRLASLLLTRRLNMFWKEYQPASSSHHHARMLYKNRHSKSRTACSLSLSLFIKSIQLWSHRSRWASLFWFNHISSETEVSVAQLKSDSSRLKLRIEKHGNTIFFLKKIVHKPHFSPNDALFFSFFFLIFSKFQNSFFKMNAKLARTTKAKTSNKKYQMQRVVVKQQTCLFAC